MILRPWILLALLTLPSVALAQAPIPTQSAACELQVSDLYKGLVAENLITDLPGGSWSQQLASLTSRFRTGITKYRLQQQNTEQAQEIASQQADIARQLQQQIAALQARVRELEAAPPAAPAPPAN